MSYIPFTEQQREQARRTDLAAFLRQCGEEVKRSGSENMWLDHGHKVTIRGNLWFHQYEQVGGDAIDFACRFYNMEYPEAVQLMLAMDAGTIREPVEPFPQKPLEIPQKHENMRRVYGYLLRHRGIDKEVLDAFSYRGLVYESTDYHNAVFVGADREGKPRHIHKHSTAAQGSFKGNAPGSEPEYSFHWVGGGDNLVDSDDVHVLMIGASGVGKTAYFLYPNLEYACASGMSFLALDTKGDLARNYGAIARDIYGYRISVVDLREPTRSDGNNLLTLINRYMDDHRGDPTEITAKAKAEKYAKILAKTIISPEGEGSDHGQNAYFYDAAEGLLASVVLLLSEFLPPEETDGYETRHIASVFKLVQELLMQGRRGGNQFQELMQLLPSEHKAKWLAGSALTASDQAMNSIMSTVLSRLNAFLDTELEQVLCFDGGIDAEQFVREKCAIFLILPEEDATKNFVASLMIQNLARELFSVANEHGGKLPNRAVFFCDELGTMPPFDILPLFSAGRSRRLTLVPIIQSLAQLEKNYGKEGAEILADNCQDTIFGGFAPNSQTAEVLSRNLGSRTVLSGSVTQGKDSNSQSLQMMERPLMSPDELKSMPKGSFVIMKTGTHPMKTKLKLFLDWGIRFEKPLEIPDRGSRPVHYAGKTELEQAILSECPLVYSEEPLPTQTTLKPVPIPEKITLKT